MQPARGTRVLGGQNVAGSRYASRHIAQQPGARRQKGRRVCGGGGARCDASPAAAATGLPRVVPIAEQCAGTRERLRSELLAGGLAWLWAGDAVPRNGDVPYPFRPASDFVYATGLSEPGWGALLDIETGELVLAAPRVPEEAAIWSGPLPTIDEVGSEVGASRAIYLEDLKSEVSRRARGRAAGASPLLHVTEAGAAALAAAGVEGAEEGAGGPRVTSDFLPQALARSRARKTAAEVACLLEANRASAAAHEALWAACEPGAREYQLEAAFYAACASRGLRQLGYPCIVGAGRNAGILHYERNAAAVGPDDLVLVDAGAEFRCYTADITRTFPASGAFGARARAVYDVTLAAQAAALAAIRPGARWKEDVEAPARRVMLEGLAALGLVKGSVEELLEARVDRVFCPHGLGHHLGLDVHDVSETGPVPQNRLEPGHVVTCEPGVYFMPLLLERAAADEKQSRLINFDEIARGDYLSLGGVRIEDNVAILPDGGAPGGCRVVNLTEAAGAAPKAAAQIEAVMAAQRAGKGGGAAAAVAVAEAAVAARR